MIPVKIITIIFAVNWVFVLNIVSSDFIVKGSQNGAAFKPDFDAPRDFSSSSK